jgi:hypothetical protein
MAVALTVIEANSRRFISRVKAGIEGGRGEMGKLMVGEVVREILVVWDWPEVALIRAA